MREVTTAFANALTAATTRGIAPRRFFWATVRDLVSGAPVSFGYWTGDRNITLDIPDGTTGSLVTRTYVGGVNLSVGTVPRTADLEVQEVDISLTAIPTAVQSLVRGHDARFASVEIHVGLLDPDTRLIVPDPAIEFLAIIDGAPIETGEAGGESRINIKARSDAVLMLSRKNPRRRSHEDQKRRSNDQFSKHASVVGTWQVRWGMEDQNSSSRTGVARRLEDAVRRTQR